MGIHSPLFLAITLLLCLNWRSVDGFLDDDEEISRGNKYIDKILYDMLEENGHEYDPYYLEDSVVGFWKKMVFVNVSGEARLHNGYITGLKTLHRPDNCKVNEMMGKLYVEANLGAGVLDLYYDGTMKFMNFGPTINVHGVASYVEIYMEFTVNAKTGREGKLTQFYITEMKGMKIEVTGLGPLSWALNFMISGITTLFQGFIKRMIENYVRSHIADRITTYQFPIEGDEIIRFTDPPTTDLPRLTSTIPPDPEMLMGKH